MQPKGYTVNRDLQNNEATISLDGVPVYKFGCNPKWGIEEFVAAFEHHVYNLQTQLIIK